MKIIAKAGGLQAANGQRSGDIRKTQNNRALSFRAFCGPALAAIAWAALGGSAHAQWVKQTDADAFTGKSVTIVKTTGKVLQGAPGETALVFRNKEGKDELFWKTPVSYVCDSDMDVMMRFGDAEPEKAIVDVSTNNQAVFFYHRAYVLTRMAATSRLLLKLTDHCGNVSVVEFSGDPTAEVPELSILSGGSGWRAVEAGYVQKEQAGAGIRYRTLNDGRDDLYFYVLAPQNKGVDGRGLIGKDPGKAKLTIAGRTIDARAYHRTGFEGAREIGLGEIAVTTSGAWTRKTLTDAIATNPVAVIEFGGRKFEVDLTGFEQAAKLG